MVVKICIAMVTRARGGNGQDGGLERMAITPFFPYLLYTLFRSSNVSHLFSHVFLYNKHCDRLLTASTFGNDQDIPSPELRGMHSPGRSCQLLFASLVRVLVKQDFPQSKDAF